MSEGAIGSYTCLECPGQDEIFTGEVNGVAHGVLQAISAEIAAHAAATGHKRFNVKVPMPGFETVTQAIVKSKFQGGGIRYT